MVRTALRTFLLLALLASCATNPVPTFSTDFRPGGGPADEATGDSTDLPAPREDVPPAGELPGGPDGGTDTTEAEVPPGADVPPVGDVPGTDCQEGAIRGVACGRNGAGRKPQSCIGGQWVDGGPCDDPDACIEGSVEAQPCGLNGRGTREVACQDGQWVPGGCRDPDECTDGDTGTATCGKGDTGTRAQRCEDGRWVADGACVQPGRWRCVDNACTPSFGDPACGDGQCAPRSGESRTSCPADCDPGTTAGQGQPCGNAADCAFYPWPGKGPGYWECRGLFSGTCSAVETGVYCGTDGYDYCYIDLAQMETDGSCPQDCVPQYLNCGSDLECIYQDWPVP